MLDGTAWARTPPAVLGVAVAAAKEVVEALKNNELLRNELMGAVVDLGGVSACTFGVTAGAPGTDTEEPVDTERAVAAADDVRESVFSFNSATFTFISRTTSIHWLICR